MHIFTYHIFFTKGIGKFVRLYEKNGQFNMSY